MTVNEVVSGRARIICVSNRLPVSAVEKDDHLDFIPSSGGLVSALGPILRQSQGVWIGWPGAVKSEEAVVRETLNRLSSQSEFVLFPVTLNPEEMEGFYEGFSNSIIWPLFHDLQTRCNFEPNFWSSYLEVQEKFALEIKKHIQPDDLIWVQDYHLMGLAKSLRSLDVKNKVCFFLHTPFPGSDIFLKLPWRKEILEGMLKYDLIGFQTKRDQLNFINCLETITPVKTSKSNNLVTVKTASGNCVIGVFPISVDYGEIENLAFTPEVAQAAEIIRNDMNVEYLILSIDRLDYTKGIPDRIKAFRRLLELEPTLKKKIALLQVVVPSRVEVAEYQVLRSEVEQLVTQLNGDCAEPGWVPVHHLFRSLSREEVITLYRAADVALVTPLKDGMNLVCKEYCASRIYNKGALVLSEFAGAADELSKHSFMVNPHDVDGVAAALKEAIAVSKENDKGNMKDMREGIKQSDVYNWARNFLKASEWEWNVENNSSNITTIWEKSSNLWERLSDLAGVLTPK